LEAVSGPASPTFMDPAKAGEAIRTRVDPTRPLTVADAAAKAGLPLRDAESGLTWLSHEYRGQLRVTSEGQLVHVFPTGFTKPWETREAWQRAWAAVTHAGMSVVRFVVRAWVAIVLVAYVAIFVALILGMAFARQGNDSRRSENGLPGGALAYGLMRVVSDALFWTFHPWSPFSVYTVYPSYGYGAEPGWGYAQSRRREPQVPFYERVNRFFFGPHAEPEDPRAGEQRLTAAIRAGKGRIGLGDVMRVTGLPREKADPLMAKLMLDYDGDVAVSEDGGIVYRFPEIRKSASEEKTAEPPPAWARQKPIAPLTGNSGATNLGIVALNAFNLLMGGWAIENGLTIERVMHLFDRVPYAVHDTGVPIVLGVIPVVFSLLLFAVPAARLLQRPGRLQKDAEERGRMAVLRTVLERIRGKQPVTDRVVADAWQKAAGSPPPPKRIDRELVALGGDVAIEPEGQTRWRFADLETEASAIEAEREAAAEEEARLGEVIYATDRN
jgi:hypothetical protein